MISVAARTAYPAMTPAPRARLLGFAEPLRAEGVELDYLPTLNDEEYAIVVGGGSRASRAATLARATVRAAGTRSGADLLLVHRLLLLLAVPGLDPPRRLDVYDFDDALHVGSVGSASPIAAALKRESGRWRSYVRSARLVIAGNAHLAAVATRERGVGRVEVVPTCIDPGRYPLRRHGPAEQLTVGWIGSPSTAPYLEQALGAVERVVASGVSLRLLVIGAELGIDRPWLECRPWSLADEPAAVASFDVGLMPMPDDEWSRGKCGYKLLQYFAAGVPAIASRVGVAPQMVGSDRGLLATGDEEWVAALRELAADAGQRTQMGKSARAFVEREYSYTRWAPELARMIAELA